MYPPKLCYRSCQLQRDDERNGLNLARSDERRSEVVFAASLVTMCLRFDFSGISASENVDYQPSPIDLSNFG
jgi:hypothetical protein